MYLCFWIYIWKGFSLPVNKVFHPCLLHSGLVFCLSLTTLFMIHRYWTLCDSLSLGFSTDTWRRLQRFSKFKYSVSTDYCTINNVATPLKGLDSLCIATKYYWAHNSVQMHGAPKSISSWWVTKTSQPKFDYMVTCRGGNEMGLVRLNLIG